jgi:peptidoglycan/xylan/chitin deacetylase (PgdA/CDA1 family)
MKIVRPIPIAAAVTVLLAAVAVYLATTGDVRPHALMASTFTMPPPLPGEIVPTMSADQITPPGFTLANPSPVINTGPRTGNDVALTFDADMTPVMAQRLHTTPGASYANLAVISTLEQRHVAATFFITGMWVDEYPDVMHRIAGNPDFEIGNHTWDHRAVTANCYGLPRMRDDELPGEVMATFAKIRPYGGHQTNFFRFPGLCHDAAALTALTPTYVTAVDGDVVSGDPGATAAAPIVNAVLSRVRPGSIVVMHITKDNARFTDQALPAILDGLVAKGLHPVRLSQLFAV